LKGFEGNKIKPEGLIWGCWIFQLGSQAEQSKACNPKTF
jgi:hypothetical protein